MEATSEIREFLRSIGRQGGKQRIANSTPEQIREQASKAGKVGSRVRWERYRAARAARPSA